MCWMNDAPAHCRSAAVPTSPQHFLQCHPTKPPPPTPLRYTVGLLSHSNISAAQSFRRRLLEFQAPGATAVLGQPISHLVAPAVTHEAGDHSETSSDGRRRRGGLDLQQSPACRNLPVTCRPHKPSASQPRRRSSRAFQTPALGWLFTGHAGDSSSPPTFLSVCRRGSYKEQLRDPKRPHSLHIGRK